MENAATLVIITPKPRFAEVLAAHLPVAVRHETVVTAETAATALLLLPETPKEVMQWDEAGAASGIPALMLLPEGVRAEPQCRYLGRPVTLEALRREVQYLLIRPRILRWEGVGHFDPVSLHLHNLFGQNMALTEKEAALLTALAGQPKPQSAEALLQALWHYHQQAETHTFDTHLYRLRQKLEGVFSEKLQILHQEAGYVLQVTNA